MVLLHVPVVQELAGSQVGNALGKKLGTSVQIGRVDLGFLNRIVVDDVLIYDQANKKMLQASRLSAKIDLLPLLSLGKVNISSAQIFGLKADLYKKNAETNPNFQFVLDSLASQDSTSHTPLDLRIQSLVVRNGAVKYNQWDAPQTAGRLNLKHLDISNISTHVNLYTLTDDSVSINIKKLSLKESSGLNFQSLAFELNGGKHNGNIENFNLQLPNTQIRIPQLAARYKIKKGQIDPNTVDFNISINESAITPSDIASLFPELKNFRNSISLIADANGNSSAINIKNIRINSSTGSIGLKGSGNVYNLQDSPRWDMHLTDMKLSAEGIQFVARNMNGKRIQIPEELIRLGNIRFKGDINGQGNMIAGRGNLHTDAGNVRLNVMKNGQSFKGDIQTDGINIARILDDNKFGQAVADIKVEGSLKRNTRRIKSKVPIDNLFMKGNIARFDYNNYHYHDINIDGTFTDNKFSGKFAMNDPNGQIDLNGILNISQQAPSANLTAAVRHFNPQALKLTNDFGNRTFNFNAKAYFTGNSLEHANGFLNIEDFAMTNQDGMLHLDRFSVETGYESDEHFIDIQSDFGNALIRGQYNYETLPQSFINLITDKLPTLPGLPKVKRQSTNDFALIANIHDASLVQNLLGIPIKLHQPLHIKGSLNDRLRQVNMDLDMPAFTYNGELYENAHIYVATQEDTLLSRAYINKVYDNGRRLSFDIDAHAINNLLTTSLVWDTHNATPLHGILNAETEFFKTEKGTDAAHMRIHPSEIYIDNKKWEVQPSDIIYSKNHLNVDHFQVSNQEQHVIVNGLATNSQEDSLIVNLHDIDVAYVLDLVNFHSVDFSGLASGQAIVKNVFGKPDMNALLDVKEFRFQDGRMGTLHAKADYDLAEGQINIDAIAEDAAPYGQTIIRGYVSPKKNYIDLGIRAEDTRIEFVQSFCGSFMDNVKALANGECRVFGDLREVNLEGQLVADGAIDIKTLNTTYTLRNDTITMVPDEIIFQRDTVYDRNNHRGIVTGGLHHKHLTRLTFDINVEAQNLLAYDFHDFGDQTFYGTFYGTGSCYIKGRKGEITFDINAKPERGSFIEYNAAGPEGINNGEFIHWHDVTEERRYYETTSPSAGNPRQDGKPAVNTAHPYYSGNHQSEPADIPTDIRLNFLVNTTPDFTLRVLMDETTGDKISLNGNGVIRANYFNKGAFDMFGNYLVEHGTYTMAIQDVVKKEFVFQSGSSIIFGGDPFNAALNLKGQYLLPSVSLSDLQMGRSFTRNGIRVNCLMNIEGTAGAPSVTFGLDMPTLSTEAQQMVRSVINSEEDMNQQVLYLLAVGRFLPQGSNNAQESPAQQSQTSLAMQSLLSGTLSQQINTVLSNVVKDNHWNFGANISTGDEGFNNAEYEGLLSGRLLNNRLLINGEFGYRDNVNTQQSNFIGDFDVQYLLYPNGNLAIKVYNETNDRYFTRNSLTTQGIGVIMKKDFTTLGDLFGKKKTKKSRKKKQ
ncbi:MAG: translocation/assembly module TamB domain-containing protein [Prevotella sp.]|nr:translocation/assembly module TamB domain-containing protein [Prevotella sp.]